MKSNPALGAATIAVCLAAAIAGMGCGDGGGGMGGQGEPGDTPGTAAGDATERSQRPVEGTAARAAHVDLSPERALGQVLVGRYSGSYPAASFLARIRAGELGGVILFGENVEGGDRAVRRVTRSIQRTAVESGNPPLLIFVDQEGGSIKRLPGPPDVAPGEIESTDEAAIQGARTGRYLRELGINVDLAPVVDVPSADSFIAERAFGMDPYTVAERACAFASGLLSENVAPTLKHFPGLGQAQSNTDSGTATVTASAAALRRDYAPYRDCGANPKTLTMLSSASYPSLTGTLPAVTVAQIYDEELSLAGARGLTISDDLEAPALDTVQSPATDAFAAGLNLALYAKTEGGSADAHSILAGRLKQGTLSGKLLVRRARPILALKALLEPRLTERILAGVRHGER